MSGYANAIDPGSAIESGACAFLRKPVRLRELEMILRQVEEHRRSAHTIRSLKKELDYERIQRDEVIRDRLFAKRLHSKILPKDLHWLKRSNIAFRYIPLAVIGGDYLDVLPFGSHQALIIIADVSGHGTPAAFGGISLKT